MAITNAQQYKQLVNPPMKGKKRPGYRGDDAAKSTGAAQSGRVDSPSTSGGSTGSGGRDDTVDPTRVKESREEFETAVGKANLERLKKEGVPKSNLPGFFGAGLNAITPFRNFTLRKNIDYFEDLKSRNRLQNYPPTLEGYTQYMKDRSAGTIDAAGNPIMGGDDNDNMFLPVDTTFAQAPGDMDQGTETEDQDEGLNLRFRKDGGRINAMDGGMMDPEGGIMDLESGRQMYFLGKLVKKATRTVKKIAKSPIGKAALLYAGGAGLASLGTGTSFMSNLMSPTSLFRNLATSGKGFLTGISGGALQFPGAAVASNAPGAFKLGEFLRTPKGILTGITAASTIAGMLTPEQEEQAQLIADETGIDIAEIRANPDKYLARRFRADGGIMRLGYQEGSKEPVAKKTMPLLDMGGKEMDLREDGGFVPLGRMERADDVPARLSKNEFVFTADAVRNAGDGNVDKGAEVMYNMMKNLESGGDVSEESQGLKGAREMFQTSQRLEEVL